MQIKSLDCGDCFLHENGNKVIVQKIYCAFDENEVRWDTSVKYALITVTDPEKPIFVDTKARHFVQMIQGTPGERSGFVTQVTQTELGQTGIVAAAVGTVESGSDTVIATQTQQEKDFIYYAHRYGLQPTDLGRKIKLGGKTVKYTIVGAKPRNYKMPILVKGPQGGVYKISAERAVAGLR